MKDKIKIGIVDTGIYSQHPYFKGKIEGIYEYRQGKLLSFSLDTCNDMNGHGTACTSVILKECPNAQIYVYKLLDERGEANLLSLEQILLSLLDSKIDVINLSLAITEPIIAPNLKKICKEIISQNKFLVAALGNDRKKSIPSVYSHCYGVKGSILNHLDEIWFNKYKRTQCIVDNTPYLHCDVSGQYQMFGKSNSYAAAKMTGIIAYVLEENGRISLDQMNRKLYEIADKKIWLSKSLKRSRRYPDLKKYKGKYEINYLKEIEEVVQRYLDKKINLQGEFLFSHKIGLTYDLCYGLLKQLEQTLNFITVNYTEISREDFYTIEHLAHMIKRQME